MRVRNLLNVALLALLSVSLPSTSAMAKPLSNVERTGLQNFSPQNMPDPEEDCPAITGIEVEFSEHGSALITWNAVLNIQQYTITIVDEYGNVLVNTAVGGNQFVVDGLEPGVEYTITICYICPYTGEPVCGEKKTRYVIIEDVVVMLDGNNCGCNLNHSVSGNCTSSGGFNRYPLSNSKIYKVALVTGEQISFVYTGGHIRRVGSCPINYTGRSSETHGITPFVEYMKLNNSKIYFHNNHFCIESALILSVKSCNIIGAMTPIIPPAFNTTGIVAASAFPNPFTDVLNVEIPGSENNTTMATVQLFDSRGLLVYEEEFTDLSSDTEVIQLNVGGVEPGVYWLVVIREGEVPMATRVVKLE